MKVLIVRGFPDLLNLDAYNVQELGLSRALRKKGICCDIALYGGKAPAHTEVRDDGTLVYWLTGTNVVKNGILHGLKRIAKDYDVLQVHEYDQLQSWLIYTFWNKPTVLYHGMYYDSFNRGYNAKTAVFDRTFLVLSRLLGKTKALPSAVKSPMAETFLRQRGFDDVASTGVGLDAGRLTEKDSTVADRMPEGRRHLIYVGKLEERRNAALLPAIFAGIAERVPDAFFTVIGKGEASYTAKVLAGFQPLIDAGNLLYVPQATQSQVGAVFAKAELMVFPTNFDIFGMVLLEAMYERCVCLSSVNGGSTALIEDGRNGKILHGFAVSDWVEAAVSLLSDKKALSAMAERAGNTVRTGFLWDHLADSFIALYERSLS